MEENNKAKKFMLFGLIVLVITIAVSSTYAYYVWTTSDSDTTKIVAGVGSATVTFDGGSDIENANLRPVSDKSKGIIKTINVKGDTTGLVFNMYLDLITLPDALKEESFRYALYNGETLIQEGNFSSDYLTSNTSTCTENSTTHITLLTNEAISTSNVTYTLYIWIDGANYTNPNTMMNQTFSFKLHANGEGAVLGKNTADYTLQKLNALNSTIAVDTSKTPDFSTVSGNNGVKHNNNDSTTISNQGDGTKGIYVSEDDLGKSYYFRGAVENNYVKFGKYSNDLYYSTDNATFYSIGANCQSGYDFCTKVASTGDDMYWRIIRINGDGSVRMIYAGTSPHENGYVDFDYKTTIGYTKYNFNEDDNTYVGYMYGTAGSSTYDQTHSNTNDSTIKTFVDTWYQIYLSSYSYAIADAIYCNDRNPVSLPAFGLTGTGVGTEYTAYADASRNWLAHNPSLKCTNMNDRFTVNESNGNGALTYPVGLITTDEVSFAGAAVADIVNNTYITNKDYYLYNSRYYWTMTADAYGPMNSSTPEAFVGSVNDGGYVGSYAVSSDSYLVRPVVSLRSDAISGGRGTMTDPFVVG